MEEERDIVTFSDDDGNEFDLEVIDYFDYEEQEYAVLIDPEAEEDENEEADTEVYIMKVVVNGEYEEFLPADEDKMDVLSKIVEERLVDDGCGCGCGDDCDCDCDDDCDCEEHDHDCGCGCGCHDDK